MTGSTTFDSGRLTTPLYSYAEADRLAGVGRGTSSRWLKGYRYWYAPGDLRAMPPVTERVESQEAVSFVDLVEVIVIGGLRKKGFSLRTIRKMNEFCQLLLQKTRPLVTETFKVSGRDIFVLASHGHLVNVSSQRGMQAWDEVLDLFLETVDYENELARRWWPMGREYPVVVDPEYGFGLPVVSGSGVRTEILAERARAGDADEEISYDFGLDASQVEAALRYEGVLRAA